MRVLLTGATGFLGNNLLRQLTAAGHQVQVTLRPGSNPQPLAGLQYEVVHGDLSRIDELLREIGKFDVLIHSAALIQIGWSKLEESRLVNGLATERLAEYCRLHRRRMIHVSTVDTLAYSPDGHPNTEDSREPAKPPLTYVQSKKEAEAKFQKQVDLGLDGIIVHPGFMVGPWDWKPSSGAMMVALAKGWVPFAPAGGCSVVDVRDVADGIISAIEHAPPGQRFILGGENLTYLELWRRMSQIANRRGPRRKLPDWLAKTAGSIGDLTSRLLKSELQVNSAATAMGQLFHYYDSQLAEKTLGYRIGSVDDALQDAFKWLCEFGYIRRP